WQAYERASTAADRLARRAPEMSERPEGHGPASARLSNTISYTWLMRRELALVNRPAGAVGISWCGRGPRRTARGGRVSWVQQTGRRRVPPVVQAPAGGPAPPGPPHARPPGPGAGGAGAAVQTPRT